MSKKRRNNYNLNVYQMPSIAEIMNGYSEVMLQPIITDTKKATLNANKQTAEFQAELVEEQITDLRNNRKKQEDEDQVNKVKEAINQIKPYDTVKAEELNSKLVNHLLEGIDWIQ